MENNTLSLDTLKNNYAKEHGYEDWYSIKRKPGYVVELYMNEICIRAQKAALEKAAENTSTQYVRPKTFNYKEIENFITNENNLIR